MVLLECGDVQLLLTGDAEVPSESSMLAAGVLMDIDILKVGHHGSRSSTSGPFLDMIRPEVGIISAGLNSQYGHPHQEIVERLTAAGVELWHTDISDGDDTVKLTSDCQSFSLERALFPPEPSVNPTPVPPPNPMPLPTATPLSTATPVPTDVPSPTPAPSAAFGSGALRVGADIEPGTYQNSDSSRGCYWARLLGFSWGVSKMLLPASLTLVSKL